MKEIAGFDEALPKFEAAGAQVVGVSADHWKTLEGFVKQQPTKHLLLADFRRTMLPAYDAMVTDEKHPIYRYPKRAYFIIDKQGTVRFVKVMENPTQLLNPDEVLAALKSVSS